MIDYPALVNRCRALVAEHTTPDDRTAVLSRGDAGLSDVDGRTAVAFPAGPDGRWIGYHPADGAHALGMLDAARAAGATHLLVPATSAWWFEHYPEFDVWLAASATVVTDDPATGRLYELPIGPEEGTAQPETVDPVVIDLVARLEARHRRQAQHLVEIARATSRAAHPAVAGRGWVEPSWTGVTHLVVPEVLSRVDADADRRARDAAASHPVLARHAGLGVVHVLRVPQETTPR